MFYLRCVQVVALPLASIRLVSLYAVKQKLGDVKYMADASRVCNFFQQKAAVLSVDGSSSNGQ